jgi:cytoskeleton protein RodZ
MSEAEKKINNHEPPIDLDKYDDMSVGEILRKTREHYDQSLGEVEENLRIRSSQLEALEKLELEKLPGRVYAIGFVRAYSEYLGLDGDKMVQLFKAQSVGKRAKPNLRFPVTYDESNAPNLLVILLSLVGTILLISYWVMYHTPTQHKEAIPPVPEVLKKNQTKVLSAPEEKKLTLLDQTSDLVIEEVDSVVTSSANKMELHIKQDSWVEITNAQSVIILSQVLEAGDKYVVPDEVGLTLTTGNAGGVHVVIDGEDVGAIGRAAQVKRNIKLEPDSF